MTTTEETSPTADEALDSPLGENGKRALAAEREARKSAEKDLKAALARIGELEAGIEASEQKHTAEIGERDAQISALSLARTRDQVLREKGVPDGLADFVQGDSREELEATADKLLAGIPVVEKAEAPAWKPDPSQGAGSGGDVPLNSDALTNALAQAVGAPVPGARF